MIFKKDLLQIACGWIISFYSINSFSQVFFWMNYHRCQTIFVFLLIVKLIFQLCHVFYGYYWNFNPTTIFYVIITRIQMKSLEYKFLLNVFLIILCREQVAQSQFLICQRESISFSLIYIYLKLILLSPFVKLFWLYLSFNILHSLLRLIFHHLFPYLAAYPTTFYFWYFLIFD